jgi:hypothetical protein
MKSPSSMRNGRFNTSRYRGKLQKMGVLYTYSSKRHGPFSKLLKKNFKKINFFIKRGHSLMGRGLPLTSGCPPAAAKCPQSPLCKKKFFLLPFFFAHVLFFSLVGWLQHMPTLPRLFLKFSNIHNF